MGMTGQHHLLGGRQRLGKERLAAGGHQLPEAAHPRALHGGSRSRQLRAHQLFVQHGHLALQRRPGV